MTGRIPDARAATAPGEVAWMSGTSLAPSSARRAASIEVTDSPGTPIGDILSEAIVGRRAPDSVLAGAVAQVGGPSSAKGLGLRENRRLFGPDTFEVQVQVSPSLSPADYERIRDDEMLLMPLNKGLSDELLGARYQSSSSGIGIVNDSKETYLAVVKRRVQDPSGLF